MNRIHTVLLGCCAGLLLAGTAHAQFFGQMGPLSGMPAGGTQVGAYLAGGSGDMGLIGELRRNADTHSTLGVAASLVHSTFAAQADLRTSLATTGGEMPFELGGQLAAGLLSGGGSTGIYAQAVPGVSLEFGNAGHGTFSTWAGAGFRLTAATHSSGVGDGVIRLGARYNFTTALGFSATLEDVGGTSRLIAGGGYNF